MSNYRPLIGFPNRADDGTLSGGGWETDLPLANLQDRRMHKVARSTDATTGNTTFDIDLGAEYDVFAVGVFRHNLSLSATYRLRGSTVSNFGSTVYDSGAGTDVFQSVYPTGSTLWGEDVAGNDPSQDDVDSGLKVPILAVFTTAQTTRYWRLEISDTGNSDGYVELGRLFVAQAYRPSAGVQAGAEIGYQESTDRIETPGGAFIYDARDGRRVVNIDFALIDEDEALVNWLEIQRRIGMSEQFMFTWDPTDSEHLWRRTFVGAFRSLFPANYPGSTLRMNQRFQIVEEL